MSDTVEINMVKPDIQVNKRPINKIHYDDKPIDFITVRNKLRSDRLLGVCIEVYTDNGTNCINNGFFNTDKIVITDNFIKFGDSVLVNNESVIDWNWFANGFGFVLRIYN